MKLVSVIELDGGKHIQINIDHKTRGVCERVGKEFKVIGRRKPVATIELAAIQIVEIHLAKSMAETDRLAELLKSLKQ